MFAFVAKFGVTPGAVRVLTRAFDDAWVRLEDTGGQYSRHEYAEAAPRKPPALVLR